MTEQVGLEDLGDGNPFFSVRIDASTETVRITMRGTWNLPAVQSYATALIAAQQQCRAAYGRLKSLTDASEMTIQPREVTSAMNKAQNFEPGDRHAVIVSSMLAKVTTRRYMTASQPEGTVWEVFMSPSAAETWLQAG